ncbi:MAG TPA: hypothetical protein VLB11_00665 [Methyloceanibacter sp.]|nr:hypothetical protein [Methyloceanibacter sp.]
MRFTILSMLSLRVVSSLLLMAAFVITPWPVPTASAANPFDVLLGSWRGNGQILLSNGARERLKCNAYYTGGGSQLGMAIRCQSESSNVEIRSKLSQSGNRITGTWEERTYNATGTARGQASGSRISLQISGGVTGTMSVSYSGSRQSVAISTQGIALKSVTIDLSRS